MFDRKNKKKKGIIGYLFWGLLAFLFLKKEKLEHKDELRDISHNFLDFYKKEKKEFNKLIHKKESLQEFEKDTSSIFMDYFIPHEGNKHHPKILRKKQLISVLIFAFLVKASLVSYLFFIYPNTGQMSELISSQIIELINKERIAVGVDILSEDKFLSASAMAKAENMISADYFAHEGPGGKMPWDWISQREYPYIYVGENLGMNFSSADSVHRALMDSPSHKKNILNGRYNDIGIAVVRGVINGKETNVLVQMFGAKQEPVYIPNPNIVLEDIASPEVSEISAEKENEVLGIEKAIEPVESEETRTDSSKDLILDNEKKDVDDSLKTPQNNIVEEQHSLASSEKIKSTNKIALINISEGEEKISMATKEKSELLLGDKAKSFIEKKTLALNMEENLSPEIAFINSSKINKNIDKPIALVKYSDYLLLTILVLFAFFLVINIVVVFRVQHKPAIIQTFLVLILVYGIYSMNLHFVEKIPEYMAIF